jgi:hypothetical protein
MENQKGQEQGNAAVIFGNHPPSHQVGPFYRKGLMCAASGKAPKFSRGLIALVSLGKRDLLGSLTGQCCSDAAKSSNFTATERKNQPLPAAKRARSIGFSRKFGKNAA